MTSFSVRSVFRFNWSPKLQAFLKAEARLNVIKVTVEPCGSNACDLITLTGVADY
jgi:hypothetical protein